VIKAENRERLAGQVDLKWQCIARPSGFLERVMNVLTHSLTFSVYIGLKITVSQ